MYTRQNWFEKYGAYILFAISKVMTFLIIYFILQKFEVLKEVASSLESTARELRAARISGVGIPSG